MNTKSIVKGSLATLSMTLIGGGVTLLMAKDLYGLVLIAVGIGLSFWKEYYNSTKK